MRALGLVVGLCLAGCVGFADTDSAPPAEFPDVEAPDGVFVTGITVIEDDWFSLEVEVHLYDADTGRLLGCTVDGLDNVDESGVSYPVLSEVVGLDLLPLSFDEIRARSLVVQVVEDDADPCPMPMGSMDDLIGESPPLSGALLEPAVNLEFDNVRQLVIGTARTRID